MNRYKIGKIVEYVKSCGEFPYDMADLVEDMHEVITEYGIYSILTDDEYYLLLDELLELAERSEISEAVRWANQELVWASDFRIPNYI
jgi:hypothetical protein